MSRACLLLLPLALVSACGPTTLRVVMNAQNASGQSGYADFIDLGGGKTRIELVIAASDYAEDQPAHVHAGRCGEIGAGYVGLVPGPGPGPDGARVTGAAPGFFTSRAELGKAFDELTNGEYALNVHDARDLSLYVSCGDIN